jgi:hypothetical protein
MLRAVLSVETFAGVMTYILSAREMTGHLDTCYRVTALSGRCRVTGAR